MPCRAKIRKLKKRTKKRSSDYRRGEEQVWGRVLQAIEKLWGDGKGGLREAEIHFQGGLKSLSETTRGGGDLYLGEVRGEKIPGQEQSSHCEIQCGAA